MPAQHLLTVYLISFLLLLLPSFGLAKLFQKAGVPKWKAYVPFYNTWIMQTLGNRYRHWAFWQAIPVVGWFITLGIYIEFVKLFGRFRLREHLLTTFFSPFYFIYLGTGANIKFVGIKGGLLYKKQAWREWTDAAVFAVVAATLIRTFVFEAYAIPSGSMEKTLLVGDYLFVNKISYGPRIPNTPLSIPFVHNYIPGTSLKSYTDLVQLGTIRWFASPVKRGDVAVFNVPIGDTVINKENFQTVRPYYDIKSAAARGDADANYILTHRDEYPLAVHPFDKADNYIKRCMAVAGDVLQIRRGVVYINGVAQPLPPQAQMRYQITTNGQPLDADLLKEEYGIDLSDAGQLIRTGNNNYEMLLTTAAVEKMKTAGLAKEATLLCDTRGDKSYAGILFPYDAQHTWTLDDYGPLWVPKRGQPLVLTPENYSLYERAIRTYEHNKLELKNGLFYINGKETKTYTFQMDYYWMMGDNRHASQDSRFWGFVPDNRIVGKPSLIWFSTEGGPRWSRIFKGIQ
ncbi:MAG TPA: S26 family signal peptidase [Chitinophagaceae bacterium]|nr:S26 family signal peptidase [Chitinophagaceae bacterium]